MTDDRKLATQRISRSLLALLLIAAGVLHFLNTPFYVRIVPPYLPFPRALVYISGMFEILGGVGVLIPRFRRWAGYGLIALLIAVFPANIHMAVNYERIAGLDLDPLLLWLRLPLQAMLLAWVWWCTREAGGAA